MPTDPSLPPTEVEATAAPESSELRMSIFRLARRLRAERADDSLSDGQFAVLAHLSIHGAHTLGALAERERVSPPSMNRTVNCLEESGYLRREGDPDDGRRVRGVASVGLLGSAGVGGRPPAWNAPPVRAAEHAPRHILRTTRRRTSQRERARFASPGMS